MRSTESRRTSARTQRSSLSLSTTRTRSSGGYARARPPSPPRSAFASAPSRGATARTATRPPPTPSSGVVRWSDAGGDLHGAALSHGRTDDGVRGAASRACPMTRSLHTAPTDLRLDRAFVLIPGEARFRLHQRVEAVGPTRACAEGLG